MATTLPKLTKADFTGMKAISQARDANLRNMFEGTTLSFAKYAREKSVKNALSDANDVRSNVTNMVKGIRTGSKVAATMPNFDAVKTHAQELIQISMGLHDMHDVVAALTGEVLHQLIGEMTPLIGVLTSSYKSVQSWRAVVANARDLYKADYYLEGVLPGDPQAAAEAVIVIIKRFLAANTADAIRNTASASTKIAGLFADMGTATTERVTMRIETEEVEKAQQAAVTQTNVAQPAIGAASALSKLIQELAILGRDYKEMKAGNGRLEDPDTLDMTVFQVCPILGCYLISCSDTSMVVNFFVADMGLPGWMDKVEKMKKTQVDPLIKNANKAIVSSHLTLQGLKANKGTFAEKSMFANIKEQFNRLIKSNAARAAKA
jgi:hypothetical protein